jgi:hypothetical protein
MPSARDSGDPKAESYLERGWVIVIFEEGGKASPEAYVHAKNVLQPMKACERK